MIGRYSFCWRSRSDRHGEAAIVLGTLAALWWSETSVLAASVTGTVRVEMAAVRTDGPKHDRDVVVMLDAVGGPSPPDGKGRATMDQRGLVFLPHVLAIQKGSTVTFLNNDNELHNVQFLDDRTGRTLDLGTYGPGVPVDHRFADPGVVVVLCKLHLEMAAFIVVSGSPWFSAAQLDAITRRASFSIANVPPGEYELRVWHKKLRPLDAPARIVVPRSGNVEVPLVLTSPARAARRGR